MAGWVQGEAVLALAAEKQYVSRRAPGVTCRGVHLAAIVIVILRSYLTPVAEGLVVLATGRLAEVRHLGLGRHGGRGMHGHSLHYHHTLLGAPRGVLTDVLADVLAQVLAVRPGAAAAAAAPCPHTSESNASRRGTGVGTGARGGARGTPLGEVGELPGESDRRYG